MFITRLQVRKTFELTLLIIYLEESENTHNINIAIGLFTHVSWEFDFLRLSEGLRLF